MTVTQVAIADDDGISAHQKCGVTLASKWHGSFDDSLDHDVDHEDADGAAAAANPVEPLPAETPTGAGGDQNKNHIIKAVNVELINEKAAETPGKKAFSTNTSKSLRFFLSESCLVFLHSASRKPLAVPASTPFRSVLRQAAMFETKKEPQQQSPVKPPLSPLNKPKNLNITPSNPMTTANVAVVAVAPPVSNEVAANVAITPSAIAGRGQGGNKLPSIVVVPTNDNNGPQAATKVLSNDAKASPTAVRPTAAAIATKQTPAPAARQQGTVTTARTLKDSPDSRRRDSSGGSGGDKAGGRSSVGSAAGSTTKDSGFFSHFKSIRASFQELLPGGGKNSAASADANHADGASTSKFSRYNGSAKADKASNRTTTPDSTAPSSTGKH